MQNSYEHPTICAISLSLLLRSEYQWNQWIIQWFDTTMWNFHFQNQIISDLIIGYYVASCCDWCWHGMQFHQQEFIRSLGYTNWSAPKLKQSMAAPIEEQNVSVLISVSPPLQIWCQLIKSGSIAILKRHHSVNFTSFHTQWNQLMFTRFFVSNLIHLFIISFHIPLYVSSHIVRIIRRIYCIYKASGSLCVTLLVWPFGAQAVRGLAVL